jgi:HSP20 family molecular chaperone IbpA
MRRVMRRILDQPVCISCSQPGFRTPVAALKDLGDKIAIELEIPGADKDEIELKLTETQLEISAQRKSENEMKKEGTCLSERSFSSFRRSMSLPVEIVPEKAEARFENGVLRIEVPKAKVPRIGTWPREQKFAMAKPEAMGKKVKIE